MIHAVINGENLSHNELTQLYALINKANKPKSKVWKPENGEKVFVILSNGDIDDYEVSSYFDYCHKSYEIGNCFRNKDEAEEAKQALKYRAMLKRLSIESGEDENPWDGEHSHYRIAYAVTEDKLYIGELNYSKTGDVTFSTSTSAKNALTTIGEGNYKRYILGIKE